MTTRRTYKHTHTPTHPHTQHALQATAAALGDIEWWWFLQPQLRLRPISGGKLMGRTNLLEAGLGTLQFSKAEQRRTTSVVCFHIPTATDKTNRASDGDKRVAVVNHQTTQTTTNNHRLKVVGQLRAHAPLVNCQRCVSVCNSGAKVLKLDVAESTVAVQCCSGSVHVNRFRVHVDGVIVSVVASSKQGAQ